MTAEQILEKHLLLMLKRTDQSYVSVDEMKQQPEWQATINAMLEYGEMQALRIHDVSGSVYLTENQMAELAQIGSQHLYLGAMDEGRISYCGIMEILKRYEELRKTDR